MKFNKFIIDGRVIEIPSLGSPIDQAFISLHASFIGHEALSWVDFEAASAQFFTANSGDTSLHDAYFNNFTLIWNNFLAAGNYDEAERLWDLALSLALSWEASNPGRFIHKGSAYYFWGMTAILRRDLDKGYVLMHRGVEEDIRTTSGQFTDRPGYAFVSLNYTKVDQAFRQWVLEQAQYLNERLTKYAAVYGRTFTLDDFKSKFLASPPSTDVMFLFSYTVARLMNLSSFPQHTLKTEFVAQIESNLLFDIALVIDAAIKTKNVLKRQFIDHAEYITIKFGQPLTKQQLKEINAKSKNNFDKTLADMLMSKFTLDDGTALSKFQSDVAVAYSLRNLGAHDVSAIPTISAHFQEVEQAVLNVLFVAVDYLY